ncbi:sperm-associated antigen 17-like isoform X3 [Rhinoraja longicauda]
MPKKEKSAKSAKKPLIKSVAWEEGLLAAQIEGEHWKTAIYFAVGEELENEMFLAALSAAIEVPLRKLFSTISWEGTLKLVTELGEPKNQKLTDLPMFYEVAEEAWALLSKGEEIPLLLITKLLKFQILYLKQKDLQSKGLENKAPGEEETTVTQSAGKKKADKKSANKGKGKVEKKSPEPPVPKKITKLLKRGEVEVVDRCINDEPDDGPHRYIIIQGFQNLQLLLLLGELGIDISAVIKLSYERNKIPPKMDVSEAEEQPSETPEATEAEIEQKEKATRSLELFWKYLEPVLNSGKLGSKLFDIARLQYTVREEMLPEDWTDDSKVELGAAIFEDIANMIYDCEDWKRQYKNYLLNVKLITIPEASKHEMLLALQYPLSKLKQSSVYLSTPPEQDASISQVDMRYYNDLMSLIPLESLSVPLILHCILEQVVAMDENLTPPCEHVPKPRKDGLEQSLVDHLISTVLSLSISEAEKQKIVEELKKPQRAPQNEQSTELSSAKIKQDEETNEDKFLPGEEGSEQLVHEEEEQSITEEISNSEQIQEHEKLKQPLLLNLHDTMTQRTHHLKVIHDFDPAKVEQEMMKMLPVATSLNFTPSAHEDKRLANIQDLMYHCTSEKVTNSEVERTFKQFLFESMKFTKVDANGKLEEKEDMLEEMPESPYIPWDDPVRFAKEMKEIANAKMMQAPNDYSEDLNTKGSEEADAYPLSLNRQHSSKCKRVCNNSPSSEQLASDSETMERESRKECLIEKIKDYSLRIDIEEIEKLQLRSLTEWCYAEQHDPLVLRQEAVPFYRCLDTYHHKQDNSILLVFHNPMNKHHQCTQRWAAALHSDVGFRNYLEHVAYLITDWVEEEEVKYQEELAAKEALLEAQKLLLPPPEVPAEPVTTAEKSKKGKAASGNKAQTNTSKVQPKPEPVVVEEEDKEKSNEPFIREGSLKAWKKDQEKIKEEEQKKEKKGKKERPESKRKEGKIQPTVSKSSKSTKSTVRSAKENTEPESEQATGPPESAPENEEIVQPAEQFYKFTGYNFGNDVVRVAGEVKSLFPVDGGHIQVKIIKFLQGSTIIQVCVMKDGHNFITYITDPMKNVEEYKDVSTVKSQSNISKEEGERSNVPVSKFGSFSAVLDDGIILTLSKDVPKKEQKKVKEDPILAEILNIPPIRAPPPAPVTPSPSTKPDKSAKSKSAASGKGKQKKEAVPSAPVEEPPPTPKEEPKVETEQPEHEREPFPDDVPETPAFLSLNACSPDGLVTTIFTGLSIGINSEDEYEERILLRQSYPIKTKGSQPCEAARMWPAMQEASRVITLQGTVVKYMMDGSTEILFADGTVSRSPDSGPVSIPQPSADQPDPEQQEPKDEELTRLPNEEVPKKGKYGHIEQPVPRAEEPPPSTPVPPPLEPLPGTWITTTPIGLVIGTKGTEKLDIKPILVYKATDPGTGEVMVTRQDKVITVFGNDNTLVEHADGTRITTFFQDISIPDSEMQDENEKVTRYVKCIKVECVGFATTLMNWDDCSCCTVFGNGTTIIAKPQGLYQIFPASAGNLLIDQDGDAVYTSWTNNDVGMLSTISQMELQHGAYFMRYKSPIICEVMDPERNYFQVMLDGNIFASINNAEQESEHQLVKHQPITYSKHSPRLFILHADGSGTELLRSSDVEEYIYQACTNSTTAVLKEQLPEYPGVLGITFLKPSTEDIGSRWLIKKDVANIIPPNLQSRRWDTFPQRECKVPGPPIGMQPCDQPVSQPACPVPAVVKCPPVLEVHQLFQYEPINKEKKLKMQMCLKEYIELILQREQTEREMMLKEPRSEEEVAHAADLLKLVQSFPEDDVCHMEEREASKVDVASIYEEAVAPTFMNGSDRGTRVWTTVDTGRKCKQDRISQWPQKIAQYRQELEEEKASRLALENMIIPPYFLCDMNKAPNTSQEPGMNYSPYQMMTAPSSSSHPDSQVGTTIRSLYQTPDDAEAGTWSLKRRDNLPQETVGSQYQSFTADVANSPTKPIPAHGTESDTCPLKRRGSPTHQEMTSQFPYPNTDVDNSPAKPTQAHGMDPDTCPLKRRGSPTHQEVTSPFPYPNTDITKGPAPAPGMDSGTCPLKRRESSALQAVISHSQDHNPDVAHSLADPMPAHGMGTGTCSFKRKDGPTQQAIVSQQLYSRQEDNNRLTQSAPAHYSMTNTCSLKSSGCPTQEAFPQEDNNKLTQPSAVHHSVADTCGLKRSGCPTQEAFPQGQCYNPAKSVGHRIAEQDQCSQKSNACCSLHKPLYIPVNKLKDIGAMNGMVEYKPEELPGDGNNLIFHKSLVLDAANQPRRDKVKLPAAILSSKPFLLPNQRFAVIEEPVRRKVNTVSIAGPLAGGLWKEPTRGFELFPREVNFGILQEGFTYAYTVSLKNVGIDSCRFRVKQPPPGTGLRVYFKPGPVAAGLKTDMEIELYAIAIGLECTEGAGYLCHHLGIQTEAEELFLSITATVLTECFYKYRPLEFPKGGMSAGVRLICTDPTYRTDITRPRKALAPGAVGSCISCET